MINLDLQRPLRTKIHEYINNTYMTQKRQAEMQGFMDRVQPSFKKRCLETVFRDVTSDNIVLSQLKKSYTKIHVQGNHKKLKSLGEALLTKELESQAHRKLVEMLKIVLTMPEEVLIRQEDKPDQNPIAKGGEDDDDAPPEPTMYFVAKGKYDVFVKKNHGVSVKKYTTDRTKEKPDRILQDGDHFGEIGLIYNCKRTATVESSNYGTLAALTKSDYTELQKSFENITEVFKKQICLYDD